MGVRCHPSPLIEKNRSPHIRLSSDFCGEGLLLRLGLLSVDIVHISVSYPFALPNNLRKYYTWCLLAILLSAYCYVIVLIVNWTDFFDKMDVFNKIWLYDQKSNSDKNRLFRHRIDFFDENLILLQKIGVFDQIWIFLTKNNFYVQNRFFDKNHVFQHKIACFNEIDFLTE